MDGALLLFSPRYAILSLQENKRRSYDDYRVSDTEHGLRC